MVFALLLSVFLSCVNNYPKPPKKVYNEKEMVQLYSELLVANEWLIYYTGKNILGKNIDTDTSFRNRIFKDLKADIEKFQKSIEYYDENPALQTRIFDSVYNVVNRMEATPFNEDSLMLDVDAEYKPEDFRKFRERYLNRK